MRNCFLFLALSLVQLAAMAQIDSAKVASKLNQITNPKPLIQTFQDFGVKAEGNQALHDCAAWLKSEYESYGFQNVHFDTFTSPLAGVNYNVVAEMSGETDSLIIIGSHFDTKGGPGANDNGTGVATTLLLAKALQGETSRYSLRFINFAGEEQGFYGSEHQAKMSKSKGEKVLFYFNLDQLGGTKGASNNYEIVCERDEKNNPPDNNSASSALTAELARIIPKYTNIKTSISNAFSSDYEPYQSEGYVITGLYQASNYPFTHSAGDTLGNVDTDATWEIARGAFAVILELAKVKSVLGTYSEIDNTEIVIYPNPSEKTLYIDTKIASQNFGFEVFDMQGNLLLQGQNSNQISVAHLPAELYTIRLLIDEKSTYKRFVVR